jgi:hypothetical protein
MQVINAEFKEGASKASYVTPLLHVIKCMSQRQQRRHQVALDLLKAALKEHSKVVQDTIDGHEPSYEQASNFVSNEEARTKLNELNKAGTALSMRYKGITGTGCC